MVSSNQGRVPGIKWISPGPGLFFCMRLGSPAILILATDEHGKTRINTEGFNKLTIKQKSK
jgi:hypothetical protein